MTALEQPPRARPLAGPGGHTKRGPEAKEKEAEEKEAKKQKEKPTAIATHTEAKQAGIASEGARNTIADVPKYLNKKKIIIDTYR